MAATFIRETPRIRALKIETAMLARVSAIWGEVADIMRNKRTMTGPAGLEALARVDALQNEASALVEELRSLRATPGVTLH